MQKFIVTFLAILSCCCLSMAKKPQQPDSYAYTRGVEAYNEGNYADALNWFGRELSEHPDNGYAYVYVTILCMENQEYGNAISAIDDALKRLPNKDKQWRSFSYAFRGEIYAAMSDTIKALDDFSRAIQIDPSNPSFYDSRAQMNYELNNYSASDADYQKMISLNQGDVKGYMGIGRNAKAQMRWEDAIRMFDHAIKLSPDYSSGYSFRAEAYIGQEKWAEATDDIIKALDIDDDVKAFHLMLLLPKEAMNMLKLKLSVQMAKQPADGLWPYYIAALADYNDDYDEAISYYEKANALEANSLCMRNIAKCYMDKADYERALDYADRALVMDPEKYDLVDLKADILSRLGKFDECLVERDRYVSLLPEYPIAYLSRADDLLNARRYKDAIQDYLMAIVLAPELSELPYLLMRRGDAFRLMGKNDEARKDYEALLNAERDSVLSVGSCTPFAYSGMGEAGKAIETMRYILENDTTDVEGTLYNAACIYARLGQKNEAIEYLKKAVAKGYKDFHHIEADYDLDCLRGMPEYQEIISSCNPGKANEADGSRDELPDYNTATVEIPFTKEGGVTKVKCTINGLPLHFVFDTGAADVTMSMVEANFMLKNDYIKPTDIVGSARYMDANGDITEGTIVNLRSVDFGGLELENVRAAVVRNQKAPLLLGQSVLGRLGKIEIDNPGMKLVITHKVSN